MSSVSVRGLTKRFEGKPPSVAVDQLDLDIPDGEFLVLLGPSGCGKTTTLRCLAGLEDPSSGSIQIGDTEVFDSQRRISVPPDKRFIGMVFQAYGLWPHMTVRANIAYALKARGMKRELGEGWVERAAGLVHCEGLLDRYPAQLSGGQQQRVALARGLVARPNLLLFDEPLSNLDARLRDRIRSELHELHESQRFTGVFVTHDQSEAMALGTTVAVMRAGRIEQMAKPKTVFESPATAYVAEFIGVSNELHLQRAGGEWLVGSTPAHGAEFMLSRGVTEASLRVRPEDLRLAAPGGSLQETELAVTARVTTIGYGGRHYDVGLVLESSTDVRIDVSVPSRPNQPSASWAHAMNVGDEVVLAIDLRCAHVYDRVTGERLAFEIGSSCHPAESVGA